ncbi:MAG: hypothetical protein CMF62_00200 [Magnetococcales bacterium]|nr:hypothetical protein [Magnetococcales bacterium]|tara:strand:- start:14489 stop:16189 length:1701 start_codon:yes stop_codon:yes gene_type:complete
MAGGLLQIVSYGSQDIFLTGNPEITFFNVVYRRHTNFSVENIELLFDDDVGFGRRSTLIFPKVGDLLHKLYLKIVLPRMDLERTDATNDFLNEFNTASDNLSLIEDYFRINMKSYTDSLIFIEAENITTSERIIQAIQSNHQDPSNVPVINSAQQLLGDIDFNKVDMQSQIFLNNLTVTTPKEETIVILDKAIKESQRIHTQYYNIFKEAQDKHLDESNPNIKFAWVKRLGHAIIDQIEIEIGGNTVERQYGSWLNIWYELAGNKYNEENYFKMIGNVPELTDLNRNIKPEYNLYIPLQFWFCRSNGVAIPLVALQYHDVHLIIKLRNLQDVSYVERDKLISVPNSTETLFLDEVNEQLKKEVKISVLADYIYLDYGERKRFAQSSHEYLIEELQQEVYRNIDNIEMKFLLDFEHPCKELIWYAQQTKFLENPDGYTETQFDNYSLTEQNGEFLINDSLITFHSYDRVRRRISKYFNYVQPYSHHRNTPSDGINVYSFALHPEEYQPSGTANFSRLTSANLLVRFNPILFPDEGEPEDLVFTIYAKNYNVLRILSGMAATAYTSVV